jgi:hypothetical protein
VATSIEGLAILLAEDRRADQAAQLLALASALRRHMGAPTWPADQAAVHTAMDTARLLLGEEAVAKVWAHAHALPLEQLLDAIAVIVGGGRQAGSADTSAPPT